MPLRAEHDLKFHVIAVLSNPSQYKSRYELYKRFAASFQGATLWTLELAHGARNHVVTQFDNPNHIQLWNSSLPGDIWYKENLLNLAIAKIIERAPDARYIGYSDGDFLYEPDAMKKTVEALQRWDIVQMWSHLASFDHQGHTKNLLSSFMYCHYNNILPNGSQQYPTKVGSPGGAWAFRREILNKMGCAISGPILDFGIVGSGDLYFANALIGRAETCIDPRFHPNYKKWIKIYQENTDYEVKRNVGYVANSVRHMFHGSYQSRGYNWRSQILIRNKFDPETDIIKDSSGIWRLVTRTHRQFSLRDDLRRYFDSRNEDNLV